MVLTIKTMHCYTGRHTIDNRSKCNGNLQPIALRYPFIVFITLLFCSTTWATQGYQSRQSIVASAEKFAAQQLPAAIGTVEVKAGRIDPRLKLAKCGIPLTTFFPTGSRLNGNTTVGVRCDAPKPWSLYVPVRIKAMADVVVAARYLARGETLRAEDFVIEQRDIASLPRGYFTKSSAITGKYLKRALMKGSVVPPTAMARPKLIKRGERITIIAQTQGIEVRMAGRALTDGSAGQTIRARNLLSKKIVEGKVVKNGVLRVPM
ncbi:MAG: flagellar basal body P-ring formation protein FlgA [Gammaproteobacteria bacterium]|nr:flagellar basal body P-ring formation protein FlgA [Gammaproteobacteria bacterium]